MEQKTEKPMVVVEEATTVLSRISSLCNLMMCIDYRNVSVQGKDVAQIMAHFRDCLDEQIEALDGIVWS